MTLAVGVDHDIVTDNPYRTFTSADEDTGKMVYRVEAKAGQPIKVIKVVAYHTSRGVPVRELVDRCRRTLDRVLEHGIEPEFAAQREWLDAFWERSDVVVHGQPALQQAIRWNLFQVGAGHRPGRAVRGAGQGGDRLGLRRALLLGHRDLRAAVPHLHLAADGPQRAALPLQHARRGPPPGGRTWPRAARCSRGARSTARRRRPTTRPAPRSTTSTPTSRTRCASTWTRAATRSS